MRSRPVEVPLGARCSHIYIYTVSPQGSATPAPAPLPLHPDLRNKEDAPRERARAVLGRRCSSISPFPARAVAARGWGRAVKSAGKCTLHTVIYIYISVLKAEKRASHDASDRATANVRITPTRRLTNSQRHALRRCSCQWHGRRPAICPHVKQHTTCHTTAARSRLSAPSRCSRIAAKVHRSAGWIVSMPLKSCRVSEVRCSGSE